MRWILDEIWVPDLDEPNDIEFCTDRNTPSLLSIRGNPPIVIPYIIRDWGPLEVG